MDTDAIIPDYHSNISEPDELAKRRNEGTDRDFVGGMKPGDFILKPAHETGSGHILGIEPATVEINNLTKMDKRSQAGAYLDFVPEQILAGGLIARTKRKLGNRGSWDEV